MPYLIFVLIALSCVSIVSCSWIAKKITCIPAQVIPDSTNLYVKVYLCILFTCVWISLTPYEEFPAHSNAFWEWQVPQYFALHVIFSFLKNDADHLKSSILYKSLIFSIASLSSFLSSFTIITIVWSARSSKAFQTILFSTLQPSLSCLFVFAGRRSEKFLLATECHLLELLSCFESFAYGVAKSDGFMSWKIPLYGFLSFSLGVGAIGITDYFLPISQRITQGTASTQDRQAKRHTKREGQDTKKEASAENPMSQRV